jgi:hypothetical protein
VNSENAINAPNEMKPGMRKVVIVIFALIAAILLVIVVDKLATDVLISISNQSTSAEITKVKTTKSKSVVSTWITYSFEVNGQKFERKALFGAINQGTEIRRSDSQIYTEGSEIEVTYSKLNPSINEATNDPYKNDKNVFMIIGIFLFGFMAFNETRGMLSRKKNKGKE